MIKDLSVLDASHVQGQSNLVKTSVQAAGGGKMTVQRNAAVI
jgi:hypothetical protein